MRYWRKGIFNVITRRFIFFSARFSHSRPYRKKSHALRRSLQFRLRSRMKSRFIVAARSSFQFWTFFLSLLTDLPTRALIGYRPPKCPTVGPIKAHIGRSGEIAKVEYRHSKYGPPSGRRPNNGRSQCEREKRREGLYKQDFEPINDALERRPFFFAETPPTMMEAA